MCQEFGKDIELQKLKLAQMLLEGSLSRSDEVEDTYFPWLNSWSQVNSVQLREGGVYPQGSKTWVCADRKKKSTDMIIVGGPTKANSIQHSLLLI